MNKLFVIGAGLSGCVFAERAANELKLPVTIIEKRNHAGGNCWSETEPGTGIEVHKYGPHIFHTSDKEVWDYISSFTQWNSYRHTVWSRYQGKIYSLPFNLQTINKFYGREFTPLEARKFLAAEIAKANIKDPLNLEEKAISLIGRPLYEAFVKGYTMKQWEKDPRELPAEIISRLPVRYNYDNHYYRDLWEGMPLEGYPKIFENMLANPLIDLKLNTDWQEIKDKIPADARIVFTGPIDSFFDYQYGPLEWRTLEFEKQILDIDDYQGTAVVNMADISSPYTRVTEFKHFHPERAANGTVIMAEKSSFARDNAEPYYPVNTPENHQKLAAYQKLAPDNVFFCGRLGTYSYLDMDKCIRKALDLFNQVKSTL